jgi:hypothetical protein
MKLAGKYASSQTGYTPDTFPNQVFMQEVAKQSQNDPEMKQAALDYQYPFKMSELLNSNYSPRVKEVIANAAKVQQPTWSEVKKEHGLR